MKQEGIDITIRNSPEHVLAPDDWSKVMAVKFGRMKPEDYTQYYKDLLKKRWGERRQEILDLAKKGMEKDIRLKCYCPHSTKHCHAHTAAKFLNGIVDKLMQQKAVTYLMSD